MSSNQLKPKVEHLQDQFWYDYLECLRAVERKDRTTNRLIGHIFMVQVVRVFVDDDEFGILHMFWALKLCESGPLEDRYRMCLHKEPLVAQRTLRGIEPPLAPRSLINPDSSDRIDSFMI